MKTKQTKTQRDTPQATAAAALRAAAAAQDEAAQAAMRVAVAHLTSAQRLEAFAAALIPGRRYVG